MYGLLHSFLLHFQVHDLKNELTKAHDQTEHMFAHISVSENMRDIPGENNQDTSLQQQVEQLQRELQEVSLQRQKAQKDLNAILRSPRSDGDTRVIPVLKRQLNEAQEELSKKEKEIENARNATRSPSLKTNISSLQSEINNLKSHLKHTEHLNNLLKHQLELNTQSESSPSGFNPELIVKMAQEIERLKEDLENTRTKLRDAEGRKDSSSSVGSVGGNGKKTGIPVRAGAAVGKPPSGAGAQAHVVLQKQMESLRSELNDQKVCILFIV